jgi:transcriptional regulator with XRE-family HTH domain
MSLRKHLRDKGLRQRDVAQQLGVSEPTVSKWLSGKQIVPGNMVLPLAGAMQMDPEALLRSISWPNAQAA